MVRKEVIKLLDAGIVYPILDSKCVSLVQCVPKKGIMTVVTNDKNELIPTRTVIGWRICMDYRKLNEAMRKHHYPVSFIDQMLDRLLARSIAAFSIGTQGIIRILLHPNIKIRRHSRVDMALKHSNVCHLICVMPNYF